jgi:septum formation protein
VIGADTIVLLGRKILGKPKDMEEAVAMLKSLSGKSQKVITGIAVIFPGKKIASDVEITKVKMKKVSLKDIKDYVSSARPLDKAGAYGIQELDEVFIESIEGDYDNVVGLPVYKLKKILVKLIHTAGSPNFIS